MLNPIVAVSAFVVVLTLALAVAMPASRAFAYPELVLATVVSVWMGVAVCRFIGRADPVVAVLGLLTFLALAGLVVGYLLLEVGWIDYGVWYLRFKLVSVLAHLLIIYILANIVARGLWRKIVAHQRERERLALEQQRANTLSVLSSGTVHHFHNKLLSVRTGLRFLEGRMGVEQRQSLKVPLMLKAVDQAFALSQQLAGTLRTARESEYEQVDLRAVLSRALADMDERRPPDFVVALEDEAGRSGQEAVFVRGVPSFVKMAFENLVANAFDACPPKQAGRLLVRLTCSEDGQGARVTFEDDGTGIPAEVRDQVFVPFFTTKEDAGGTGFGLYWSRRLVEAMGGRLGLDWTEVGVGTRFVIDLPLCTNDTEPVADGDGEP